ncbi:hypothetical protein K466DRAFT_135305 [Polyporus arcularius HHB13444]|uniref:Uncharacterized protein n=1 Tax=Polyporus arcularius HHB13444 TaxID=1314778 RepID=A0A5C3PAX8_9APHY|nr:hypothetical protein K466DRAFT_135305 [Polyporus arcularius HHB13444]
MRVFLGGCPLRRLQPSDPRPQSAGGDVGLGHHPGAAARARTRGDWLPRCTCFARQTSGTPAYEGPLSAVWHNDGQSAPTFCSVTNVLLSDEFRR